MGWGMNEDRPKLSGPQMVISEPDAIVAYAFDRATLWRHRSKFTEVTINGERWYIANELAVWRQRYPKPQRKDPSPVNAKAPKRRGVAA